MRERHKHLLREQKLGGQGQSPPIRGGGHARQQSDDGQGDEKHREREDDRHVPPPRSKWSTEHAAGVLWNTGGMYRVELYAAVRRSVYVEGWSERAAARRFGAGPRDVGGHVKVKKCGRPSTAVSGVSVWSGVASG